MKVSKLMLVRLESLSAMRTKGKRRLYFPYGLYTRRGYVVSQTKVAEVNRIILGGIGAMAGVSSIPMVFLFSDYPLLAVALLVLGASLCIFLANRKIDQVLKDAKVVELDYWPIHWSNKYTVYHVGFYDLLKQLCGGLAMVIFVFYAHFNLPSKSDFGVYLLFFGGAFGLFISVDAFILIVTKIRLTDADKQEFAALNEKF